MACKNELGDLDLFSLVMRQSTYWRRQPKLQSTTASRGIENWVEPSSFRSSRC